MSNKWQCPQCNSANIKPVYVLRLEELKHLGAAGVGTINEPLPQCIQCGFTAEVNAMLRGEYDYEEKTLDQGIKEKTEIVSSSPKPPAKADRLAIFVVGGIAIALICLGIVIVGGVGFYLNQSKKVTSPSPQSTTQTTPTSHAVVVTDTKIPGVAMLDAPDAQKLTEGQEIPFLARKAVEEYSNEELNKMGTTLPYTILLNKSEPLLWGTGWCTTTEVILAQNFEDIRYSFILNGTNIPIDQFVKVDYYSENVQGYCRQYYTVLTNWAPGEYVVKTMIEYLQPINDGWDDYPAGKKIYEYHVTVSH